MIVIDGTNLVLGRLATFAAKKALEGEEVIVVNSENVIISGKKKDVISIFKQKVGRGTPLKGPFYPKQPDRVVRRVIRGMIPYKQGRGKLAFARVMCYLGVPEKYKNEKMETIKKADFTRLKTAKFISLSNLCKEIGGK
ncbi:MAG: 50S ribosomal protein L13 [Nanoarchaeota archaeon]|nr:50S ribosomal protein L13 [Nanoarchaeota archaeon]